MIGVSKLPVQTKVSKRKIMGRTKDLRIGLLFLAPSILLFSIFCSIHCLGRFTIAFI